MGNKLKRISILLTNWEYYPWQLIYFPVYFYYLFNVLRTGKFFYFSNVNRGMKNAGFFGNTKTEMYKMLPIGSYPTTIFVPSGMVVEKIEALLLQNNLDYPLIIKPNIGERGEHLEKLENKLDLQQYIGTYCMDCIIQPFVPYNFECSIFCYRQLEKDTMKITSIVGKDFLKIKGDGLRTIEQLIDASYRAFLQKEALRKKWASRFDVIPLAEEVVILRPNANHSKGASFFSLHECIDEQIEQLVDFFCKSMPSFQYGRFDIRCESLAALKDLKHYKIIEVNGIGAEPIDMYIPGTSVIRSWRILLKHWQIMYSISSKNRKQGLYGISDMEGWKELLIYYKYKHSQ